MICTNANLPILLPELLGHCVQQALGALRYCNSPFSLDSSRKKGQSQHPTIIDISSQAVLIVRGSETGAASQQHERPQAALYGAEGLESHKRLPLCLLLYNHGPLEPGLTMWQNGRENSLKVPGDGLDWTGLDWTGTRSQNVAERQGNLVESARGWTGLDWTGLDWTGTRSLNVVKWQGNLVKSARGWTGLDWTGLDWNPVSQCCKMAGKPR
jgi:hypothetical protein